MFPQIFGKYVLERQMAAGGMAVVYLATLRGAGGFEKRLVVKQIRAELATDPAFVRRFVEEAKTSVELSHPGIVPVYELGVEQGVYYIAMELAEGISLAELLRHAGRLDPAEGAHLGVEICRALDYAHRKGRVVHRDVTPRNVMVDDEGHVRLIDFGIAAPVRDETPGQKVFGSPGHMPPEQIRGRPLTPAADVFAVGALLLEVWTGKPPFRRETAEASERALGEPVEPLSRVVPELADLDALIGAAVALDADARPASAEELARPLRAFLRDVDAADVARRLGRRVSEAREAIGAERASRVPDAGATSTPAASTSITRTFAARDPWLAGAGERPVEPRGAGESATEDTQPIDSLDRPSERSGGPVLRGEGAWRRRLSWALPLAFLVAAAGAWLLVKDAIQDEEGVSQLARPAASMPVRPLPSAALVAGGRAHDGPGPSPSSSAAVSAWAEATAEGRSGRPTAATDEPGRASATASHGAADGPEAAAAATLTLTSDLPASVHIGGHVVGTTPLRGLRRRAGLLRVTFDCGELGERVGTTVHLEPGQSVGLHAEFTRATPAVRQR